MIVNDGTGYDLSTGIYTGFTMPVSNEMQEIRQVFWPRWTDCSIAIMTWGHGEPAAVADIEIYELDHLPELDLPPEHHDPSRREFGIQYEDPCGTGAAGPGMIVSVADCASIMNGVQSMFCLTFALPTVKATGPRVQGSSRSTSTPVVLA